MLAGVLPATTVYFWSYEAAKKLISGRYGAAGDFAVGAAAQLSAGVLFTPVDIIKERLQACYLCLVSWRPPKSSFALPPWYQGVLCRSRYCQWLGPSRTVSAGTADNGAAEEHSSAGCQVAAAEGGPQRSAARLLVKQTRPHPPCFITEKMPSIRGFQAILVYVS